MKIELQKHEERKDFFWYLIPDFSISYFWRWLDILSQKKWTGQYIYKFFIPYNKLMRVSREDHDGSFYRINIRFYTEFN